MSSPRLWVGACVLAVSWSHSIESQIIRSYTLKARAPAIWRVTPSPILAMGGSAGRGPTEFVNISAASRLTDGKLVVIDKGSLEVRLFSSNGQILDVLLRKGPGPREIDDVDQMFAIGDTMIVMQGHLAVHIIRPDPQAYRKAILSSIDGYVRGRAYGSLGSADVVVGLRRLVRQAQLPGYPSAAALDSVTYARIRTIDSAVTILGSLPDSPRYSRDPGRLPVIYAIGFAPAPHFASAPGRYCLGFSSSYTISCFDSLRRPTFTIRRETLKRHVSQAAQKAFRSAVAGLRPDGSSRFAGPLLEHRKRVAASAHFSETYPAYSGLLLARNGDLWVRAFDVDDGLSLDQMRSNQSETRWSIFDLTGRWLADCTLPRRFAPAEVGADYVLGVSRDEDDVERLELYGLVRR